MYLSSYPAHKGPDLTVLIVAYEPLYGVADIAVGGTRRCCAKAAPSAWLSCSALMLGSPAWLPCLALLLGRNMPKLNPLAR
eukprot:CAMPEP_0201653916 /NCGR_PEP_ID=MMETSP0493-20130528/45234_1 /ASSEMBLY_ACC=CAM_ASM_000838 /TAXON_ID=420259 /ORGANISM="Thalassiosira gravida, Strain GMp14c1" /LENGTH=80 /DNA_ID=CAMNT_0048130465 /DNA_START=634 /DNA_END=876 /DNA_ORIENTATION=+